MDRYNKNNLSHSRHNRRQRIATRQEGVLWHTFLKSCPINFCRQYRADNYILDFYAPSIRLAIEIDGGQHYEAEGMAYDAQRTATLKEMGITVMRLSNKDIDKRLKASIQAIVLQIEALTGKPLYDD